MSSSTTPTTTPTTTTAPVFRGGFTEAVPLSLSSMAHMTIPLENGVLDGLYMILQHTLLSGLNLVRAIYPPYNNTWTFSDLCTSEYAWESKLVRHEEEETTTTTQELPTIPTSLTKHGFDTQYTRTAILYFKPALVQQQQQQQSDSTTAPAVINGTVPTPKNNIATTTTITTNKGLITKQEEEKLVSVNDWTQYNTAAIAKITLLYATVGEYNAEELEQVERTIGTANNNNSNNTSHCNPCVLYKVIVEYRSLPSTGKKSAIQAEELSMLSFGGSIDDDVKYGALSSLYDDVGKYVLEIFSIRGKKYKFDLMDSTLSDGTVPKMPTRPGISPDDIANDPFVKSLCVTVTDYEPTTTTTTTTTNTSNKKRKMTTNEEEEEEDDGNGGKNTLPETPALSLTKIHLSLEGNLRVNLDDLPLPAYYTTKIQDTFISLNSNPPSTVVGIPSKHRILLDPEQAGRIYINGRYVTTWGKDCKIGTFYPALFGMDLHTIPYWHGRIYNYDTLMLAYAQVWQEVMTDAKLIHQNINGRLLSRLITGTDPFVENDEEYDGDVEDVDGHGDYDIDLNDDDDDDNDDDEEEGHKLHPHGKQEKEKIQTNVDCLESQVMASSKYDPVGICAKALATKFQIEFGANGYPCLTHEIDWVKDRLPGRVPVAVPARLIDVLRRGGYFDVKRTSDEMWFTESRPAKEGTIEETLVNRTCELLEDAKCTDVKPFSIVFINGEAITDPVRNKGLVRLNRPLRQYHVNEAFLTMDLQQIQAGDSMLEDKAEEGDDTKDNTEELALLLGLHIAREHTDGSVLIRYMLKHGKF